MFVRINHREGYLLCDWPQCSESSTIYVAKLGGDLPEGWVEALQFRPGPRTMGHLCSQHRHTEWV